MSKVSFDKLQYKPALVQTHAYKVNGTDGNSLGTTKTTICTFNFPKIPTGVHSLQTPPLPYHFRTKFFLIIT